ncbi:MULTISPECIES: GIY-YIG nuclease family protein [unclassified Mesorhizobium]|uniref:GIY-YIG nuclease family protein n=1 Tax=unclassified Mesorhizobium TaxID=325217 RepID=UPI000FCC1CB3|nr:MULTISPECIES: GIY-YIG nuclease family protein [unclassified Mesorhizobium]RUV18275.1 hypothetical protein EOA91_18305 [Mesorhizobium sp. M1A.F.Ca.IN.022.04.1.1]RWG27082.1 MAG: hypothetical protein EOQ60_26175 [Mesorhizobium sp.]
MSKIKYYMVRAGHGYWQPTQRMKQLGFQPLACGPDGPGAWRIAEAANKEWQEARKAQVSGAQDLDALERKADRVGHIYFICLDDRVKIGYSRKPFSRLADLMTGFARPPQMTVILRGRPRDEKALHQRYAPFRQQGEWFALTATMRREMLRFSSFETIEDALKAGPEPEQSLNGFKIVQTFQPKSRNADSASGCNSERKWRE